MQIVLVRHGKPKIESSWIASHRLDEWVDAYDRAGLDPDLPPPRRASELAAGAEYAISSDLPRAVESLRALEPEQVAHPERVFREAGLPGLPPSLVRLDPQLWAALGRMGWFLGWSGSSESVFAARRRARAASRRLADLADQHGSVLLLGHGIFNALIAWELLAHGWRGPIWPTGSYWSSAVYRKRDKSGGVRES